MPRSCWAEGRAMFTMVASSTTISWASAMKVSAFQRLESGVGAFAATAWAVSDMEIPTSGLRVKKGNERNQFVDTDDWKLGVTGGACCGACVTCVLRVVRAVSG